MNTLEPKQLADALEIISKSDACADSQIISSSLLLASQTIKNLLKDKAVNSQHNKGFQELTLHDDGSRILVNMSLVTEVHDKGERGTWLFFLFLYGDEQVQTVVSESFEEIKRLIS